MQFISFDISIGKAPPRSEPEWFTSNQTDNVWISIADMKTNFRLFSKVQNI